MNRNSTEKSDSYTSYAALQWETYTLVPRCRHFVIFMFHTPYTTEKNMSAILILLILCLGCKWSRWDWSFCNGTLNWGVLQGLWDMFVMFGREFFCKKILIRFSDLNTNSEYLVNEVQPWKHSPGARLVHPYLQTPFYFACISRKTELLGIRTDSEIILKLDLSLLKKNSVKVLRKERKTRDIHGSKGE